METVKTRQEFCIKCVFDINNYKHNDREKLLSYIEKNINMMEWATILLEILHVINS
jgi:hypothetical protein